jgi:hypothetical protein
MDVSEKFHYITDKLADFATYFYFIPSRSHASHKKSIFKEIQRIISQIYIKFLKQQYLFIITIMYSCKKITGALFQELLSFQADI